MAQNLPMNQREKKAARTKWIVSISAAIIVVCVMAFTGLGKLLINSVVPQPTEVIDPCAKAAVDGVTAYMNFDPANYDGWLENICSLSTETTCKNIETIFGPDMLAAANKANMISTVSNVKAIAMVDENQSDQTGHQQIWAVAYTYTNWNGTKETYDYFMITEVDGAWKYDDSVMLPQKMLDQAYGAMLTPTAQP